MVDGGGCMTLSSRKYDINNQETIQELNHRELNNNIIPSSPATKKDHDLADEAVEKDEQPSERNIS
jgi:hypothetical protein